MCSSVQVKLVDNSEQVASRQRGEESDLRLRGRAFTVCGVVFLAAGAAIAVVHTVAPVTRGWWLVAFLSLVGGVSQILLGRGMVSLVGRIRARQPTLRSTRAELVLWNGGTVIVAVADLTPSLVGVLAGSTLLLAALAHFARGLHEAGATALRPTSAWTRVYSSLLGFLALSVVVGALLAYQRGR